MKIRLIDWPYPDRPKLPQLRMAWYQVRSDGLGATFRRLRRREIVAVMVAFFVGFTLSFLLMRTLSGA